MKKYEANRREYSLDLHGHTLADAREIAGAKIREAWENGYDVITLIHGSPLIRHHLQARYSGRGGIKWEVRGRLASGEWMKYVYNRRSVKHDIGEGSMTLALRRNPNPNRPERWTPIPEGYYE